VRRAETGRPAGAGTHPPRLLIVPCAAFDFQLLDGSRRRCYRGWALSLALTQAVNASIALTRASKRSEWNRSNVCGAP
jgi:hypothetical protein